MTAPGINDIGFLVGVSVLEIGGGIAGSVAAAILGGLGAAVTKVPSHELADDRAGPRVSTPNGSIPAIDLTLDRSKHVVEPDTDLSALARAADIVIIDREEPATTTPPSDGVVVSITPFGLSGPRATQLGGELVAQAAGGLLGTIEAEDGTPVPAPGFVALRAAGAVAALAALHGLERRRTSAASVHVDVSVQEAVVFTAALPECAHVLYACPGRAGSGRYVAPSGLFPCRDGLVRITAVENHQWNGMVAALGAPAWTSGLEDRPARADYADMITDRIKAWTATQDKAACSDLLQGHGVPATPVNTPSELLSSPQFAHRGSLIDASVGGHEATLLGNPWRIQPGGTGHRARSGALADLRIVELTHVLAGPIVGALLGAMGATVIRLEDPDRLDIYRRTGPFAGGQAGVERGAYFAVANHSKHSVLIDPSTAARDVAGVIAASDVLIENVGKSRMARLEVSPGELAESGTLTMRLSGFGSDGPLAGYRVYANNVQAYGGLAWLTLSPDGSPARLGTVIADPLSSVVAATVIAAWAIGPARDIGAVVDLSMAEVVASTVAEFVAAASIGDQDPSLADAWQGHRGVYQACDGRWVAIELLSADDMLRLRAALAPTNSHGSQRSDVVTLVARLTAEQVDARLAEVGVRSAVVQRGADLVADPHLAARGFFPEVVHPDPHLGTARLVGLPWRIAGEGPVVLAPPPALGSSNCLLESRSNVL